MILDGVRKAQRVLCPPKPHQPAGDLAARPAIRARLQEDDGKMRQLRQGDGIFPRQRVRRRDGSADGALHHRDVLHLLQGNFARNRQRNVAVARLQRRADSRHRQLPHAQFHLRVMRPKRRNRPQKQLLLHRPGVGNRQRPRLTALRVRKRLYRLIALNQPLRHRHKCLPRLRQRRAGLAPLQQRHPQFRLQRRHLLAHRGLGDEALLRAEGDAARLRDGEEIREPLQFQGSPPPSCGMKRLLSLYYFQMRMRQDAK